MHAVNMLQRSQKWQMVQMPGSKRPPTLTKIEAHFIPLKLQPWWLCLNPAAKVAEPWFRPDNPHIVIAIMSRMSAEAMHALYQLL